MSDTPGRPTQRDTLIARRAVAVVTGVAAAIVYGLVTRSMLNDILNKSGTLSIAFFVLIPPALGFLTVMLAPEDKRTSALYAITAPWVACVACILIAALFAWDFAFCLILALPLFLFTSSIGGGLAAIVWLIAKNSTGARMGALAVVLALPYLSAAIEHALPGQEWVRRVETQIEIDAPPEVVWANITNLDEIQPSERPVSFYHLIGLPRPIQARMACQQVGCTRRGDWEDGLSFDGTITQIEPGRSYWVALKADTSKAQSAVAPLKGVGGRPFDMVDDGYVIQPVGDNHTILHLYSTYRVTTRLNLYASLWLDLIMRDIQSSILSVEKARSERDARG